MPSLHQVALYGLMPVCFFLESDTLYRIIFSLSDYELQDESTGIFVLGTVQTMFSMRRVLCHIQQSLSCQ